VRDSREHGSRAPKLTPTPFTLNKKEHPAMSTIGREKDDNIHQAEQPAVAVPTSRHPQLSATINSPTVGFVTALPEEFVAMRALLDDVTEHDIANDPALYTLGTLPSRDAERSHPVALTLLGATATNGAANGSANMKRSFPSIATLIMLGIAAGIPNVYRPERHVRLGDIVVATQGVIDYDHVRVLDGSVELRRPLSLPSMQLTRCADMLRTDELSDRRPWEQFLSVSRPRGLTGYGRPAEQTDIVHTGDGHRLDHPRRDRSGHRKGWPKVHYGMIGSADRAVWDATTRDQLAARHDFLAVEMEGAGVGTSSFLNEVEWFVVLRRTCARFSRSDGTWRKYASLAAATYVRSLLAKCLPLDPGHNNHPRIAMESLH